MRFAGSAAGCCGGRPVFLEFNVSLIRLVWPPARVALRQSPQNELQTLLAYTGYVAHPPCFKHHGQPSRHHVRVRAQYDDVRYIATADKVAEMEALFTEKQVSAGLTPADLLAPLLTRNRSAQSDFRPPRFLRTKRDREAVRPEYLGAAANHSWGTALDPWEIGWNAQRFTEESLGLQAVRRAFRCGDFQPCVMQAAKTAPV